MYRTNCSKYLPLVYSMRKAIILLFMSLYSVGNILLPNVDMTCLRDMYHHCAIEDPDINAADFVVEHLLNLPDVFEYFEEEEQDEHETPHQPYHQVSAQMQLIVTEPRAIRFECRPVFFEAARVTYTVLNDNHLPAGHLSQLLRPPIA